MWAAVITFLRTWGIVAALVAGGLAVAWRFVAPAPPDVVRLATGPGPDSTCTRAAESYARGLRAQGFRVELGETNGSAENLALLAERAVDLALVQGGVARPPPEEVRSLGAVFFEPAWVFVRRGEVPPRAQELRGRRVALGPPGSGTRALGLTMLAANGLEESEVEILPLTGLPAAEALLAGEADMALFVSAVPGQGISRLMRAPEQAELIDFGARASAYASALPFLSQVTLPHGGFSLPEDLPAEDITLMAPAAAVLTHDELHPQVASLVLRIMQDTHRQRQAFAPEGRFPNPWNQDVPLQRDAQRIYERGQGFLQSWLPFRVAVAVERLWVLLIPLVTLALPLIRFAPPLYTWQMESRIWRYYDSLRRIEGDFPTARDREARAALRMRLDALDQQVARLSVPASYARHLFALRRDIAHLRARVPDR
jgi:TRAP-type uncharacterized transport system substrate-binding protein